MNRGLLLVPLLCLLLCCKKSSSATEHLPFEDAAKETGLDFWQYSGATGEFLLPEVMGSGAALIDYDNDGDMDVYLVQGTASMPAANSLAPPPAGWKPGNRLFRNNLHETGKLTFTDVTDSAGVGLAATGMGVAAGDYDNDGYTDLYVTNYGYNVLFHNNGNGTFTDVTAGAGVASSGWSSSAAFVDYDKDGLLDLVVVHYLDFVQAPCYSPEGSRDYCGPAGFKRTVTELYRNLGNGKFRNVTHEAGLDAKAGPGLGILTGDFGSDGYPGFMVANDGAANHLWVSEPRTPGSPGDRVFKEEGLGHGLAYASDGRPRAGMGVAAGDMYGDGGESILVTNLPSESFTLFQREANGDFVDVTEQSGLSHTSLPYTGFGVGLFDLDNRGLLDVFTANGAVRMMTTEHKPGKFPYGEKKLLLRNNGKGKGLEDISASAGPIFEVPEVSRAAVFGDINNDGGVDILVTNNNGPARLLLNTVPDRGHWLTVHLEGTKTNRSAYGSTVELVRKDSSSMRRWVRGDGSYLAANDPRVHFGLGKDTEVDRVEVHWLAGGCELWKPAKVDTVLDFKEGTGQVCPRH